MRSSNVYAAPDVAYEDSVAADRDTWGNRNALWLFFSLQGRIPRLAYWVGSLIVLLAYVTAVILAITFVKDPQTLQLISVVLNLPLLWTSVALQVKRWHDRDKSGWWFFISFVPIIGALWSFIELGFFRGTYGANSYGGET